MIKKSLLKIVCLLIIIGLNWSGISAIGETMAYFNNTENVTSNIFQAGVLDMTVRSGQNNFTSNAENMKPGDQVNRDIYVGKTTDSSPLKHKVGFELVSGNIELCNQLDLKIWYDHYHGSVDGGYDNRDMRLKYNGPLTSLANLTDEDFIIPHPDDQFDTDPNDGIEQWFYYSIILPSDIADSFQGEVCHFNFAYEAWQTNFPDSSQGFTDEEKLESTIKTGYWNPPVVLNEFLPNAGNYLEFIELYNRTNLSIDLDGFYIMAGNNRIDINYVNTLAYSEGSTIILPNGWLVVTAGGNLIDDSSGTITLYNPNDIEVDSYTYGSPDHNVNNTPGWTNNLVGYWPFDDDVEDKSGNNNNGVNHGATFTDSGKINRALSFDGQDDYLGCSSDSSLDITDGISIEAWINPTQMDLFDTILVKGTASNNYAYFLAIGTYYNNSLSFQLGGVGGIMTGTIPIQTTQWQHVVGVRQGDRIKTYINGMLSAEQIVNTGNIRKNILPVEIGKYGGRGYFNGLIDEVKIYNRALSDSEILQHYNDVGSSGAVPVDKSYARIPDGSDNWVDPYPTPGGPNRLSGEEIGGLEWQEELIEEPISNEIFDEVEKESEIIIESEEVNTDEEIASTTDEVITTEATTTEATITDATTTEEEITTTTEEIITTEIPTETSGETTEDVIEEVDEEVTNEPTIDEIGGEIIEEIIEETPAIEESVIEETPIDEVPAIEPVESPSDLEIQQTDDGASIQTSEEQSVVVSDDSFPTQDGAGESSGDSGEVGDIISE